MELSFKIALEMGNVTRDFHVCEILFIAVMSYICHIENRYMVLVVIENYVEGRNFVGNHEYREERCFTEVFIIPPIA